MTKPFNVRNTCENCGYQTSAETAFGRWMRHHPKLQPSSDYIVRTDTDHFILKFMTHYQGRDFQLLMLVETKEYGKKPDKTQADILNFIHQLAYKVRRNMHGAKCYPTYELWSSRNKKTVSVRYMGYHLLQFEKKSPADGGRVWWDGRQISVDTLVGILALELYPDPPYKPMDEYLRDRHAQQAPHPILFDGHEIDHIKPRKR